MQLDEMVPLLNVEDAARSIRFYTETLPFQVVEQFETGRVPIWAMLACGEIKLMINQPEGAGSDFDAGGRPKTLGRGAARRQRPSYGDTVLYLTVPDARDCHAELAARGCVVGDLRFESYGMHEFTLRDPDGYELAIGSRLTQIADTA